MVTTRLTNTEKTRRAFGRAVATLPTTLRENWRNVLMPWRMIPQPVALALIGLVALTILFGPETRTAPASDATTVTVGGPTVGGTMIPASLACAEDEVVGFVGVPDALVCVHYENVGQADAFGCIRPAFYDVALGRCVLSDASATGATVR